MNISNLWIRVVGEWMPAKWFVFSLISVLKEDVTRIWEEWRDDRPHIKCGKCGGWTGQNALCENGLCVWCDQAVNDYASRKQRWIETNGPLDDDNVFF
jgi:hypothetical protein